MVEVGDIHIHIYSRPHQIEGKADDILPCHFCARWQPGSIIKV